MGKRKKQLNTPVRIIQSDSKQHTQLLQQEQNSNDTTTISSSSTTTTTATSEHIMKVTRDSTSQYQSTSYGTIVHSISSSRNHNNNNDNYNNESESHVTVSSSPINNRKICDDNVLLVPKEIEEEEEQSIENVQQPHSILTTTKPGTTNILLPMSNANNENTDHDRNVDKIETKSSMNMISKKISDNNNIECSQVEQQQPQPTSNESEQRHDVPTPTLPNEYSNLAWVRAMHSINNNETTKPSVMMKQQQLLLQNKYSSAPTSSVAYMQENIKLNKKRHNNHRYTDNYNLYNNNNTNNNSNHHHHEIDTNCHGRSIPRNDFLLSSETSSLFTKVRQPAFLFAEPQNRTHYDNNNDSNNNHSKNRNSKGNSVTFSNFKYFMSSQSSNNASKNNSNDTNKEQIVHIGAPLSNGLIRLDDYCKLHSMDPTIGSTLPSRGGFFRGTSHNVYDDSSKSNSNHNWKSIERKSQALKLFHHRIKIFAISGAIVGGLFSILLLLLFPHFPYDFIQLWDEIATTNKNPFHQHTTDSSFSSSSSQNNHNNNNNNDLDHEYAVTPSSETFNTIQQPQHMHQQGGYHDHQQSQSTKTFSQNSILSYFGMYQIISKFRNAKMPMGNNDSSIKNSDTQSIDRLQPDKALRDRQQQVPLPSSSTSSADITSGSLPFSLPTSGGGGSSSSSSSNPNKLNKGNDSPLLVIAGKMTVEGGPCNIAQYNLKTGEWSLEERIQLSLYNSYSGGEVYSLLANYTTQQSFSSNNDGSTSTTTGNTARGEEAIDADDVLRPPFMRSSSPSSSSQSTRKQVGSGQLIVVGAFDTTYRNSQVTYCSVGMWDGSQLSKVGEGLCNSALSKGMKITTASLAGPHDVYVAGSFQTQVWNGDRHEFVKIFNIAHFNAIEQVWLPLRIGQISCSWCTVTVLALAWDSKRRQLHIAGKFNAIDGRNVPAGLAIYDYDSGHLVAHPGGGLSMNNISQDGVGTALQLDEESGVLYVMGSFQRLTQKYQPCDGLAAYEIEANRWTCIADAAHSVYPTGGGNMLLTPFGLMVAGKTTPSTTWRNPDRPYTIALLKATLKSMKPTPSPVSSTQTESSNRTNKNSSRYSSMSPSTNSKVATNTTNTTNTTTFNNITTINTTQGNTTQTEVQYTYFNWSWLPGFKGHDEPLHALTNGFGSYEGSVFIAGDNLVGRWSYQPASKFTEEEIVESEDTSTRPPGYVSNTNDTNTSSSSNFPSNYTYNIDNQFGTTDMFSEEIKYEDSNNSDNFNENTYLQNNNEGARRKLVVDNRYSTSSAYNAPSAPTPPAMIAVTEILSRNNVRGAIMAISQMLPDIPEEEEVLPLPDGATYNSVNLTIIVYCVSIGCIIGVIGAILCNRNISGALFPFNDQEKDFKGFSLDTLTYSAIQNTSMMEAYQRAMKTRYVHQPNLLTIIDPQEIFLQRIIGEGTFGRVWSAKWRTASVAVKEFVFAQAAVAGRSSQQQQIVEEIIGEAGMMAILRHPNVLQLFGCSLTAQAIWIVSELCSLGSLRQLLDDNDRPLPVALRLSIALQVAEGMTYLHNQVPPIIHRDLKSHNIFVHETFTDSSDERSVPSKRKDGSDKLETQSTIVVRIGDWGAARASLSGSRTMTNGVGTACWLAPEVIKNSRSSKFSDVYSYGIVLWELATREEVYQGMETLQIIAKVANDNLRPPVPKDCPWKDLMVKCWAENPLDRLEFREVDKELNDLSKRLQETTSSSAITSTGGGSSSVS